MPKATAIIAVWVTPGASGDRVVGLREGAIHLRVSAPAREGRANAAAEELLARSLGLPKSSVRVVRGHTSRRKLLSVQGLAPEDVLRGLGLGPPP
jgi:uncharacterized protein (TIGR00251 family)